MRLVQGVSGTGMFRPAFSKLEIMTVAAALDFLNPKLEKAIERKDPDSAKEAMVEIVLGFAVMCVFADRENTAYLEEMAERGRQARAAGDIEQECEEEAVSPPEDIPW